MESDKPDVWNTTFFEDSRQGKPWENRFRFEEPRRTYSGKVTYFRKRHPFTEKDIIRISDRVMEAQPPDANNWVYDLMYKYWQIFYQFYRPLYEAIGLEKIFDVVQRYLFETSYDFIMEKTIEPLQDAVDLMQELNQVLPLPDRFAFITENALGELEKAIEDKDLRIESLEADLNAALSRGIRR